MGEIETPLSIKPYLIKACATVAAIFAVCLLLPAMPTLIIAICWVALSLVAALGIAFPWVMRKYKNQVELVKGGKLQRFNNGRTLCVIGSFTLGAILIAGLAIGSPAWGATEWLIAAMGIPLFLGVFRFATKQFSTEVRNPFRKPRAIWIATIVTGTVMCIAYAVVCMLAPTESFNSAYQAYQAATNPFKGSGSAIMEEAGKFVALSDSMTTYWLSKVSTQSYAAFLVGKIVIASSAFFGIANCLCVCAMDKEDVVAIFSDLNALESDEEDAHMLKGAMALAVILPVVLAGAFVAGDANLNSKLSNGDKTFIDNMVDKCVRVSVYLIDDVPYDKYKLDDIKDYAEEQSKTLSDAAKAELEPLINQACDARLANVENYLEWYFSLTTDYEILIAEIANTGEDYMISKLEEGVDDSKLQETIQRYSEQAEALNAEVKKQIEDAKLVDIPKEYLMVVQPISMDSIYEKLSLSNKIITANARLATSAGAGFGTGLIAKHLVAKLADKAFFKKLAGKMTAQLSTKAALAAIGAIAGSAAPVVGNVAGFAAGAAVGVGIDFGLVQLDRWQNYDKYKQEVTDAIETSRQELLALVQ